MTTNMCYTGPQAIAFSRTDITNQPLLLSCQDCGLRILASQLIASYLQEDCRGSMCALSVTVGDFLCDRYSFKPYLTLGRSEGGL